MRKHFLFLATVAALMMANTAVAETTITLTSMETAGVKNMLYNGVKYAERGATWTFSATVEDDDHASWVARSQVTNTYDLLITHNGQTSVINWDDLPAYHGVSTGGDREDHVTIDIPTATVWELGEYTVQLRIIYNNANGVPVTIYSNETYFNMCDPAKASRQISSVYLRSGTTVSLPYDASGGYEWRYSWEVPGVSPNRTVVSTEATYTPEALTFPTNESEQRRAYYLKLTNVLPGTNVVWQDFDEWSYLVVTYPEAALTPTTAQTFYAVAGQRISMGGRATGSRGNWQYRWYDGSNNPMVNNYTPNYEYTPDNTTSSVLTDRFRLNATSTGPVYNSGVQQESEWYNLNLNYTVNVYPRVSVTNAGGSEYVISGQEFTYTINMGGGNPDGWTYSWQKDGVPVAGNTSSSITDQIENNTGEYQIVHYTVTCINTAPDGTELYRGTFTRNFFVYPPASEVESSTPELQYAVGRAQDVTLEGHATGGYYDNQGGASGGWTYQWYRNSQLIAGATQSVYTFTPSNTSSSLQSYTYRVVATNKYKDETWAVKYRDFRVIVFPNVNVAVTPLSGQVMTFDGNTVNLSVNLTGGYASGWAYRWYDEDDPATTLSTTNECSQTVYNDADDMLTKHYTVEMTNIFNGESLYTLTRTFTVNVVAPPRMHIYSPRDITTCGGQNVTLAVQAGGGYPSGWRYVWYKNGVRQAGSGRDAYNYIFTASNDNTSGKTDDVYTVHAINEYNGEDWYTNDTTTFTVHCYGRPVVTPPSEDTHLYYGSNASLVVTPVGGYDAVTDDDNGWHLTFTNQYGQELESGSIHVEERNVSSYTDLYYVRAHNKFQGQTWYDQTFPVRLHAWSKGAVNGCYYAEPNVYSDSLYLAYTSYTGGYEYGWTFSLLDANQNAVPFQLSDESTSTGSNKMARLQFNVGTANTYDAAQTKQFTLVARNTLNNVTGCEYREPFYVYVWPFATFGASTHYPTAMREGNDITLSVDQAHNGYIPYLGAWRYIWEGPNNYYLNSPLPSVDVRPTVSFTGLSKDTRTVNYSLQVINYGPGEAYQWAAQRYPDMAITVYHKPQTPTALKRKGNGTSMTMIVEAEQADASLTANEYWFVFGYTDASGVDHVLSPTQNRYYRFDNASLYNNQNRYWVYALWYYDDGSQVTSGRRYLEGDADEAFDRSDFSGRTRMGDDGNDPSAIQAANMGEGPCRITIYTTDGQALQSYDGNFGDAIDRLALERGMYVVRYAQGSNVVVKKLVIK